MPPNPDNGNTRPPPQVWDLSSEICHGTQAEVTHSFTSVEKGFSYPEALTLCPSFWKQRDLPNSGDEPHPKPPAQAYYGKDLYKALTLVHELCHFLGLEYDDQPFAPKAAIKTKTKPGTKDEIQYFEEKSILISYFATKLYSLANEGKLWVHVANDEDGVWRLLLEDGKIVDRDPNPMRLPEDIMYYAEMSTHSPNLSFSLLQCVFRLT